ncbi:uncharacterized protein LOC126299353 isoform X3 [Schistocerca gregaria]|uniref:uncharacterized protein LOC126299353 isoform X3 n=1 Tax=Schistocerca gregaria TaxID=7010 RepID=UPI00211E6687|nr:uncharacterized protein LOC126299353 isoform X3 [Schistocerca gregaria]
MDLFSSLLSVFVFTAELKEPTTKSGSFTTVVPGYELPDRQFDNVAVFSQISKASLTVDNSAVSADMGDFTEQYHDLNLTKETSVIQTTNTLSSEVETVDHTQLYTTDTFVTGMGNLKQDDEEYSVTTEQAEMGTLTPQSERNTTVGNDTSVLQMENMPLCVSTTVLQLTTIMIILLGTALIIRSIWKMWSYYFRFLSVEYNIKYTMQYSDGEFLTVECHDTVPV